MFNNVKRKIAGFLRGLLYYGSMIWIPAICYKTLFLFDGTSAKATFLPVMTLFAIGFFYPLCFLAEIKNVSRSISSVPYWGKEIGNLKVSMLLSGEEFHPYIFEDGKKSWLVKISESGKWIEVAGRFYPVALIAGYDKKKKVLVMLDGEVVHLQFFLRHPDFEKALHEIYPNYEIMADRISKGNYKDVFLDIYTKACKDDPFINKADWERIRLNYDQLFANNAFNTSTMNLKDGVYNYVLGKNQLDKLATKKKRRLGIDETDEVLQFEKYTDDYCVCNGVAVLEMLGFPANKKGIDFLFKCLGNVDAPYFLPAIKVLYKFNDELLKNKIDEEVRKAFENKDVMYLGGLIYLAKEIKYDVPFLKELKEADTQSSGAEQFHFLDEEYISSGSGAAVAFMPSKN